MTIKRLPVLTERSIMESQAGRAEIFRAKDLAMRAKLAEQNVSITCRKGCHHCCYHPVMITLLEGVSLYRWLAARRFWTKELKAAFEATAKKTKDLSVEVWTLSMIPCPLLTEQGLCKAYEGRPLVCRSTYSVGDPHYCQPHELGPETGILPKGEVYEALNRLDEPLMKRHGLSYFVMPLAEAVLYGAKVSQGEIAIEDVLQEILKNREATS